MQVAEHPAVIELAPNTPQQAAAMAMRYLVLGPGLRRDGQKIVAGPATDAASTPLRAPYGGYRPLVPSAEHIVAVHVHDSGRTEAYGPFNCDDEAYDYFPDHSSPHDTVVAVFSVPADPAVR